MAPVSLFDRVTLLRSRPGHTSLRCSDPGLPAGPENLAWRAAELLRRYTGRRDGVEIRLLKRIPAGAGLGGGSSDAATVLLGLNRLWDLRLPLPRLASLGAQLGADIPFFVHGRAAVVRGIGDRVRPCKFLQSIPLVLAWPGFPVETAWVYRNLRWSPPRRPRIPLIRPFLAGRRPLVDILENDLEAVAAARHPRIRRTQRALERLGASAARMTGSGSAVFGLFPSHGAARRAAAALQGAGVWAVAVRTLDESPVISALNAGPPRPIR